MLLAAALIAVPTNGSETQKPSTAVAASSRAVRINAGTVDQFAAQVEAGVIPSSP
jgi:hypothetical protein